jgi:GNAT superfamily N-acetyltransferase
VFSERHGQGDNEEGKAIKRMIREEHENSPKLPKSPEMPAPNFEKQFHVEASKQKDKDKETSARAGSQTDSLKKQLAEVLKAIKEHSQSLLQLKQADPEAYAAVMGLVQGVIMLGKEVMSPSLPMQKSEELEKAISTIPPGKLIEKQPNMSDGTWTEFRSAHDYSHVLPEHAREKYSLNVHHYGLTHKNGTNQDERIDAELVQKGRTNPVGHVKGFVRTKKDGVRPGIEPHSELAPDLHGKGLGTAMYEAVYAHAKNVVGINAVSGGPHTAAAHALHSRLAKKHGFQYRGKFKPDEQLGRFDHAPYTPYSYTLKDEAPYAEKDDEIIGAGHGVVFDKEEEAKTEDNDYSASPATKMGHLDKSGGPIAGQKQPLDLPEGTQINGKIKVDHGEDEGPSWIMATSGMVASTNPGEKPTLAANGHPNSSKVPEGR